MLRKLYLKKTQSIRFWIFSYRKITCSSIYGYSKILFVKENCIIVDNVHYGCFTVSSSLSHEKDNGFKCSVEEKQVFHKRCFKVLIACTFYELLTNTQSCASMLTKRTFCILLFVIVDLFVCSPNDCFFCALWEKIFAEKWKSTLFSID